MKIEYWRLEENRFLSLAEVRRLRRSARLAKAHALARGSRVAVRDWFLVELGLATGMRVSEMAALRCGEIVADKSGHRHVLVRRGKGGKLRAVRISVAFAQVWREFLEWKRACGEATDPAAAVFASARRADGLTSRALQKAFKRCLKRAGLGNYGIHALRHTYGAHLYQASRFNLRLVQRQLGHSSSKVTEVYANLFQSDLERSVERLYG